MRLATVPVSRVFTTGISRNKEIHLKVFIEDDSKIFGPSSIGFLPSPRLSENSNIPQCESRIRFRPCIGVRSILVSRGFSGQSAPPTRLQPISGVCEKTLCAGTTPTATHIGEEVFIDRNHAGSGRGRSAARQDITAETPVNFGTNEHPHKATIILITY